MTVMLYPKPEKDRSYRRWKVERKMDPEYPNRTVYCRTKFGALHCARFMFRSPSGEVWLTDQDDLRALHQAGVKQYG